MEADTIIAPRARAGGQHDEATASDERCERDLEPLATKQRSADPRSRVPCELSCPISDIPASQRRRSRSTCRRHVHRIASCDSMITLWTLPGFSGNGYSSSFSLRGLRRSSWKSVRRREVVIFPVDPSLESDRNGAWSPPPNKIAATQPAITTTTTTPTIHTSPRLPAVAVCLKPASLTDDSSETIHPGSEPHVRPCWHALGPRGAGRVGGRADRRGLRWREDQ
jgi:hypothetical protein